MMANNRGLYGHGCRLYETLPNRGLLGLETCRVDYQGFNPGMTENDMDRTKEVGTHENFHVVLLSSPKL